MSQRLNGKNPLSYLGVNPVTPPGFLVNDDFPNPNDSKNFLLGQIWLQRNTENLWMLTSLASGIAVWTPFAGGALIVQSMTGNTGGPVFPTANNINVVGDGTTVTIAGNPGTSTLTVSAVGTGVVSSLTGDDGIPVFPIGGTIDVFGQPQAGASVRFSNPAANILALNVTDSNDNTLIGFDSGNNALTATNSTGLGFNTLHALTSGSSNVAVGHNAMALATTGARSVSLGAESMSAVTNGLENVAVGYQSLAVSTTSDESVIVGALGGKYITTGDNNVGIGWSVYADPIGFSGITTGSNNVAIGSNAAGSALRTGDSSNVYIQNVGTTPESNTIRIGSQGAGAGQQNRFFAAGIDGVNVGSVATVVTEAGEQLGTAVITAGAGVTVTPGANTITIAATGSVPSYTHGTWTPTLSFGGSSVGITYATQLGDYIQIGQLVFVNYQILLTSKGAQVGTALINGFPFTNTGAITQNHIYTALSQNIVLDAGYTYIGLAMTGTSANIEEYGSGIPLGQLANTNFTNTSDISGSFCYSTGAL